MCHEIFFQLIKNIKHKFLLMDYAEASVGWIWELSCSPATVHYLGELCKRPCYLHIDSLCIC